MKSFRLASVFFVATLAAGLSASAYAQTPLRSPFVTTLSNITPLAFGMTPDDAAIALGTPLTYVEGRPGNEIFLTIRNVGGSGFSFRNDPLYLQFRNGRLTGFKADWSRNWMWK